jgi:hypothetical protein
MSQVLHDKAETLPPPGAEAGGVRRPGSRLAAAVVGLGLLLGVAAGWSASTVFSPPSEARSKAAQTARWEGSAEQFAEQAEADTRRRDAERRRWEAQADHFAPGWRDR